MPAPSNIAARKTPATAILIAVQTQDRSEADVERSLRELEQLVLGLGIPVHPERFVQRRASIDAGIYVGTGKLKEIAAITGGRGEVQRGPDAPKTKIDEAFVVVADDELSPRQHRTLELALGAPVLDRTTVILRVFDQRAQTREARLEIELARLEYELPRIRDDRDLGDQEGGGGRGGRGHSNVMLLKFRKQERIAVIKQELAQIATVRERQRASRSDAVKAALVGYTNAGKSTLMRMLTGSEVLVEDKLFATLGTTVRTLSPPTVPPILCSDTVGFIERLPHSLVASFRATLEEASEAWLLLNVVDASDPAFEEHIRVTHEVLHEIDVLPPEDAPEREAPPMLLVLNKIDRLPEERRAELRERFPEALQMSALDPEDRARLREAILDVIDRSLVQTTLTMGHHQYGIFAAARDQIRVLEERYEEDVQLKVLGTPASIASLERRLSEA